MFHGRYKNTVTSAVAHTIETNERHQHRDGYASGIIQIPAVYRAAVSPPITTISLGSYCCVGGPGKWGIKVSRELPSAELSPYLAFLGFCHCDAHVSVVVWLTFGSKGSSLSEDTPVLTIVAHIQRTLDLDAVSVENTIHGTASGITRLNGVTAFQPLGVLDAGSGSLSQSPFLLMTLDQRYHVWNCRVDTRRRLHSVSCVTIFVEC